jgi:hypothetical protein
VCCGRHSPELRKWWPFFSSFLSFKQEKAKNKKSKKIKKDPLLPCFHGRAFFFFSQGESPNNKK